MNVRRILAPTDFSDGARAALEEALSLARQLGATVDVLHVYEKPPGFLPELMPANPGEPTRTVEQFLRVEAERALLAFLADAEQRHRVAIGRRLETGRASRVIAAVAQFGHYDLIVMGTHGRAGVARWVIGSTTEKVVRTAHVPVLAIPPAHAEPDADLVEAWGEIQRRSAPDDAGVAPATESDPPR